MVSPILLSAPLASISQSQALEALKELHFHLNSTIKAATEVSADPSDQIAMTFFKEDARQMEDVQLFSPLSSAGIGLYYRLVRTDNKAVVNKLANMILMATKSNSEASTLNSLEGIWGFLLCVGITGLPLVTMPSDLFYHLSERVNDCKEILTRRGDLDGNSVKTLLATLLLYEDDARMTNSRIEAIRLSAVPEPDESTQQKKGGGLISPLGVRTKRSSNRAMDDDDHGRRDGDTVLNIEIRGAEETRLISERLKVLSVAELETKLQKYSQSAFERKSNLDLTGGTAKGRFSSRKRSSGRDADFDNFDYKGPSRDPAGGGGGGIGGSSSHHHKLQSSSFHSTQSGHSKGIAAIGAPRQAVQALRQPAKDTKLKAAPMLSAPRDSGTGRRRGATSSNPGSFVETDDNTTATGGSFDPFGQQQKFTSVGSSSSGRQNFEDEDGTVSSQNKLQVNVALNEDLSCSYRASQLSSCSVEGVVQVQVRANAQTAPFYLFLRDPSEQVDTFQENRKFADDVSDAILEEDDADRKYTISVPNGDSYFPVVRYKCVDDLRPVPIVSKMLLIISIVQPRLRTHHYVVFHG